MASRTSKGRRQHVFLQDFPNHPGFPLPPPTGSLFSLVPFHAFGYFQRFLDSRICARGISCWRRSSHLRWIRAGFPANYSTSTGFYCNSDRRPPFQAFHFLVYWADSSGYVLEANAKSCLKWQNKLRRFVSTPGTSYRGSSDCTDCSRLVWCWRGAENRFLCASIRQLPSFLIGWDRFQIHQCSPSPLHVQKRYLDDTWSRQGEGRTSWPPFPEEGTSPGVSWVSATSHCGRWLEGRGTCHSNKWSAQSPRTTKLPSLEDRKTADSRGFLASHEASCLSGEGNKDMDLKFISLYCRQLFN